MRRISNTTVVPRRLGTEARSTRALVVTLLAAAALSAPPQTAAAGSLEVRCYNTLASKVSVFSRKLVRCGIRAADQPGFDLDTCTTRAFDALFNHGIPADRCFPSPFTSYQGADYSNLGCSMADDVLAQMGLPTGVCD